MPEIEISEDTYSKLKAFKRVIDVILGEKLSKESDYAELVISIGLDRMLQDPLPKEDMLLKTMVAMFGRNPEFVCDFVAEMLEKGGEVEKEKTKEVGDAWKMYL
jgi:hypothetical protein